MCARVCRSAVAVSRPATPVHRPGACGVCLLQVSVFCHASRACCSSDGGGGEPGSLAGGPAEAAPQLASGAGGRVDLAEDGEEEAAVRTVAVVGAAA